VVAILEFRYEIQNGSYGRTPPWPVYDPVSYPTLTSVWSCIIPHPDQCMIQGHTLVRVGYDIGSYTGQGGVWYRIVHWSGWGMIQDHTLVRVGYAWEKLPLDTFCVYSYYWTIMNFFFQVPKWLKMI
jgi:hypothetical protein